MTHVTPHSRVVQRANNDDRGAEDASAVSKINGGFYTDSVALSEADSSAITRPDSEKNVTETVNDGEVPILLAALGRFYHYLEAARRKTVRRLQLHNFTLAFDGSWGPCTGCRKRIREFIDLWEAKCADVLQHGEQANLTITFTYSNAPKKLDKTGGWSTTYGWREDGSGKGPFTHTIARSVTG